MDPDGYFIRPSCIRSNRPLVSSPHPAPRNFYRRKPAASKSGSNEEEVCFFARRALPLSLSPSLFRFAASRPAFFRGLFPRKQSFRFSFRRPLFTVHIPKELEASSFQLNPIPVLIARLLSGAKIKLVHEGGRRCYRLLARALRNIFLNRTIFLKQAVAIDRGNYRRGGGLVGTISFIFCIEDPRCIPQPTGYREWKPRKGEGERRIETKG